MESRDDGNQDSGSWLLAQLGLGSGTPVPILIQLFLHGISAKLESLEAGVRLETTSGLVAGSAVAVDTRWALAAAHCFRTPTRELFLCNTIANRRVRVKAIHWRDGTSYVFDGKAPWPANAFNKGGRLDEFVLLRCDDDIGNKNFRKLVDWAPLSCPSGVLLFGHGKDVWGKYEPHGRVLPLQYYADGRGRRGVLRRFRPAGTTNDASEQEFSTMPFADFSGGPVFEFTHEGLRLRGVHVARALAGKVAPFESRDPFDRVACFIPLLAGDRPWFEKLVGEEPTAPCKPGKLREQEPRQGDQPNLVKRFILRGKHRCLTLDSPADIDREFMLHEVSGKGQFIEEGGIVKVSNTGVSAQVTVKLKGSNSGLKFMAHPVYVDNVGTVAYAGTPDSGSLIKPTFYLFRRPDVDVHGKVVKRIRLEAFFRASLHDKPGEKNVERVEDNEPDWTIEKISAMNVLHTGPSFEGRDWFKPAEMEDDDDDQDEEGDGYEEN